MDFPSGSQTPPKSLSILVVSGVSTPRAKSKVQRSNVQIPGRAAGIERALSVRRERDVQVETRLADGADDAAGPVDPLEPTRVLHRS